MLRRLKQAVTSALFVAALVCLFCAGANAYTYSANLPSDISSLKVTVGGISMPLERYPDGSYFSSSKQYMTTEEQKDYGLNVGSDLWLRGSQCVGFARYVYTALFYGYPADATIDNNLAYQVGSGTGNTIYYTNVIYSTLGTTTLSGGYSASTLKTLISACQPGAVIRVTGHSMVIMAIFNDGFVVYDANFSSDDEVDVRAYTWQEFVNSLGSRAIEALQMPNYYPGYTYSYDNSLPNGGSDVYEVDTSTAGAYEVYDCTTLNVRSAPSSSATRVGGIDSGTILTVKGTHDGWALIDYQGSERWVSMTYLRAASKELTVTFDAAGGTATASYGTYQIGSKFGWLPTGQKADCTLIGWYNGNTKYTTSSSVPALATLTLQAHWGVKGFTDVLDTSWYAPYVKAGVEDGLIMQDVRFNPNSNATRAQFVTVLAREYQRETGTSYDTGKLGSSIFSDLKTGEYYDSAIAWAYQAGIATGVGNGKFSPSASVQRQQVATFLFRYAQYIGLSDGYYRGESLINNYIDGNRVSGYAQTAMNWAISIGLIQGNDQGYLNPQNPTRRSEMVTIMTRFIDYVELGSGVQWESAEDPSISVATDGPDWEETAADSDNDAEGVEADATDNSQSNDAQTPEASVAEPEEEAAPSEDVPEETHGAVAESTSEE